MIYLDSAATTLQKPPAVIEAMTYAIENCASVGRSGHQAAMLASEIVFDCRQAAADFFEAEPDQVVFTFNATHGLNIAIRTLVHPGDRVVISGFEHNAVYRPLTHLGAEIVIAGRTLFSREQVLRSFSDAINEQTSAVICTHVSNVFGFVLPVEEIAALCYKRGIPFILDASQSAGVLPVSLKKLHAAFIAMPGHKGLYGPQGTGLLLCGETPVPLLQGGTGSNSSDPFMPAFLPDAAEAGTHNVPGIAGLLAGLRYLRERTLTKVLRKERMLLCILKTLLIDIPDVTLFSGNEEDQTGVLSFLWEGEDCEQTALYLAQQGIAVRAGLHCSPLAHQSAGTLESGTVRVSVSDFSTKEEIECFCRCLIER